MLLLNQNKVLTKNLYNRQLRCLGLVPELSGTLRTHRLRPKFPVVPLYYVGIHTDRNPQPHAQFGKLEHWLMTHLVKHFLLAGGSDFWIGLEWLYFMLFALQRAQQNAPSAQFYTTYTFLPKRVIFSSEISFNLGGASVDVLMAYWASKLAIS